MTWICNDAICRGDVSGVPRSSAPVVSSGLPRWSRASARPPRERGGAHQRDVHHHRRARLRGAGGGDLHPRGCVGQNGQPGNGSNPGAGGAGAQVTADLGVTPGASLFAEVSIDGGNGGVATDTSNPPPTGGNGGGESDLRTCSVNSCEPSISADPRLLVAGGGGGGAPGITFTGDLVPHLVAAASGGGAAGTGSAACDAGAMGPVVAPAPRLTRARAERASLVGVGGHSSSSNAAGGHGRRWSSAARVAPPQASAGAAAAPASSVAEAEPPTTTTGRRWPQAQVEVARAACPALTPWRPPGGGVPRGQPQLDHPRRGSGVGDHLLDRAGHADPDRDPNRDPDRVGQLRRAPLDGRRPDLGRLGAARGRRPPSRRARCVRGTSPRGDPEAP